MFRNYFKIAYRNIIRNKLYSLINILGLAIGIASCLMIMFYVIDETSYDRFHTEADRIYRVTWEQQRQDELVKYAKMPFPVKKVMLDHLPEVEKITRLYSVTKVGGPVNLKYKEKSFNEEDLLYADPNLFEVFDFPFVIGDSKSALRDVNSIVLTESSAKKYFGDTNPIGEIMDFNNLQTVKVTGVIKDVPQNSHIAFDFLVPVENLRKTWVKYYSYDFEVDWKWSGSWTYLLLKENANILSIENKAPQLVEDQFLLENKTNFELHFQPLKSIHLYSNLGGEMGPAGNAGQLYLFSVVAFIILLIAIINFMNLSTARSIKRAREVGIRKVMGALRGSLVYQFIGEAILISIIALFHAYLILSLTLQAFNAFIGKTYVFGDIVSNPTLLIGSVMVTIFTGLVAGSYPAFYLSAFKPVRTLKNDFKSSGSLPLRKVLVVVQFAFTVIFIFSILLVKNQLDYLKNKDLGYDKDMVLIVENRNRITKEFELFINNISKNTHVKKSYSGMIPGMSVIGNTVKLEGKDDKVSTNLLYTGYGVTDFFNMNILEGRGFDKHLDKDSVLNNSSFIINEEAAQRFGWNDGALGKEISWIGGNDNKQLIKGKVIGVVEDFHFQSLYKKIDPVIIKLSDWGNLAIKISGRDIQKTIKFIENEYNAVSPEWEFKYSFLDDELYVSYQKEEKLSNLTQYFAGLAIFISCTGLFGLIAFMNEQRKKEIAIRKTLGATLRNLAILLSKDFVILVLIASVIGCPIGYYIMKEWLAGFAYSVEISPMLFFMAIVSSLIIALTTLSYQSIKTANDNPVNALRNE